jgi:hypothetical protein
VKTKSFGGSKLWLLVVDDCTDMACGARSYERRATKLIGSLS